MRTRVLIGEYEDQKGAPHPVTVLHCGLPPFLGPGRLRIPAGVNGFLFAAERGARVKLLGTAALEEFVVPARGELLLPPQPAAYDLSVDVEIETSGDAAAAGKADEELDLLVCFGAPVGKKFYKLLGYGGALVADSEEKVRRKMREYEADPRNFGIAEGRRGADMSQYGLQVGYKSPMDGRGENQREDPKASPPEARFYVLERGPYPGQGKL